MVAAVRAGRGGPAHDVSSSAWGRVGRRATVVVGVAAVVPWAMSATAHADRSAPDFGALTQTRLGSPPEPSPVGDSKPPARHPRQVRASSNSSVAPSDTSSVDPVTDDTAVGTVSPTGDDTWALAELPVALDAATTLVGLDPHDHPWDEQPPPVVDLGAVVGAVASQIKALTPRRVSWSIGRPEANGYTGLRDAESVDVRRQGIPGPWRRTHDPQKSMPFSPTRSRERVSPRSGTGVRRWRRWRPLPRSVRRRCRLCGRRGVAPSSSLRARPRGHLRQPAGLLRPQP